MPEVNHSHLQAICDTRASEILKRDAADALVRKANEQLLAHLAAQQQPCLQLVSGTIIALVQPNPRKVIVAEKLLELSVAPETIAAATLETPVTPYVRVDAPKVPKNAERSIDTGEPVLRNAAGELEHGAPDAPATAASAPIEPGEASTGDFPVLQ